MSKFNADSDLSFDVTYIPKAAAYQAVRLATFVPYFNVRPQQLSDAYVVKRLPRLHDAWRRLATLLHVEQWPRALTKRQLWYLRNCPPCGVATSLRSHVCRTYLVCPFCWSRNYVLEPYQKFEKVLWRGEQRHGRYLKDHLWAIEFRRYLTFNKIQLQPGLIDLVRHGIKPAAKRRLEFDAVPNLGGYLLHRVQYVNETSLSLTRAGIILVEPGTEFEPPEPEKGKITCVTHKVLTKKVLAKIFGRVARYPTGWIKHATAEEVVIFLTQLRRVRMSATFGLLRGHTDSMATAEET